MLMATVELKYECILIRHHHQISFSKCCGIEQYWWAWTAVVVATLLGWTNFDVILQSPIDHVVPANVSSMNATPTVTNYQTICYIYHFLSIDDLWNDLSQDQTPPGLIRKLVTGGSKDIQKTKTDLGSASLHLCSQPCLCLVLILRSFLLFKASWGSPGSWLIVVQFLVCSVACRRLCT